MGASYGDGSLPSGQGAGVSGRKPSNKCSANLLGAVVANIYNLLMIAIFASRMAQRPQLGYWLGVLSLCTVISLVHLFIAGRSANRPTIYLVWLGLMIVFEFLELIVDYIFQLEFRKVRSMVIPYVMFFFVATGGLIGVAAQAGRSWAVARRYSHFWSWPPWRSRNAPRPASRDNARPWAD